ncbi:AAA family ATPase [Weissella paramesenteroides]|uniref:AAA family ATPase n=1 Tax=Weissella paramesenteroides TaxID=1249 RepID=UPI00123A78E4|nr:AAA family ATPase [Weissella paramesenteroides]KAA8439134.1 AAA family ATPase [Weissella paramesenteroides]KAA8440158.1 AAA family ATPase [Weissella paramesenteroides]KAA8443931.1 AAA family ATPase [Weissella paramesenteroides]KAA8446412.1 AAA family ATPase [Weissella paramesenteroides]KAA8451482.1 AAA family ATPase [Weissella paramesenteroides]
MKFYKAGEIPKVGNMYFIYGDGGTGKTSLTKLFDGRKLLLSFDGSTNALTDTDDIDVISFEYSDAPNMQKLVMSYLSKQIAKGEYQVIVLDNTTALQNWVLENIDGASKDGRQNYLKLQTWFRKLGNFLRESNLNILATAHQIDNGSTGLDGKGRFEADMNGRTFNAFTGPFDVVGRIYKENGERFIDLDTENGNHAKNRLDDRTLIKAYELLNTEKKEDK